MISPPQKRKVDSVKNLRHRVHRMDRMISIPKKKWSISTGKESSIIENLSIL